MNLLRSALHPPYASRSVATRIVGRTLAPACVRLMGRREIRNLSDSQTPPTTGPPRKKVTVATLRNMHAAKTPIAVMTAYDFPSGLVADEGGMDIVLVGDSLAMVALGMQDTSQIKLDEMLHHCRAVSRGVRYAFTVGDLPMGSYEVSPEHAVTSSIRMIQDGRVEAVKLEGGKELSQTISRITSIGIPVLGHIGLTPQRAHSLGGFRVQGETASGASRLLTDALALQDAGCFGIVIEAVPAPVASLITAKLKIPTIGIGAGNGCSGQVLVQTDMLGNFPEGWFMPRFVKRYANVFEESKKAVISYRGGLPLTSFVPWLVSAMSRGRRGEVNENVAVEEVRGRTYPAPEHMYPISSKELKEFEAIVEDRSAEFEGTGR